MINHYQFIIQDIEINMHCMNVLLTRLNFLVYVIDECGCLTIAQMSIANMVIGTNAIGVRMDIEF